MPDATSVEPELSSVQLSRRRDSPARAHPRRRREIILLSPDPDTPLMVEPDELEPPNIMTAGLVASPLAWPSPLRMSPSPSPSALPTAATTSASSTPGARRRARDPSSEGEQDHDPLAIASRLESHADNGSAILSDDSDEDGTLFRTSLRNGDRSRARRRRLAHSATDSFTVAAADEQEALFEWQNENHGYRPLNATARVDAGQPTWSSWLFASDRDTSPYDGSSHGGETPTEVSRASSLHVERAATPNRPIATRNPFDVASIIARRGFEDRPEAEVTIATALPDTDGITTLQLPTTPLRVRGALTPPPPPHAAADAKTVYHLYCGALDDAPDAAQGGCGSLVCSRAMDTRTFHGLPANFRFTTKPGSRPGRMIRAFTSDCPPPTDRVAILGQVERAQEDCGPVAEPGARDGCTCVRVALGCRTCGHHLGYFILLPCAICLRDCSSGHCFLFLADRVQKYPRLSSSNLPVCGPPPLPLTWGGARTLPLPLADFDAGLIGDPVDWLTAIPPLDLSPVGLASLEAGGTSRLPFWLLKAHRNASAINSHDTAPPRPPSVAAPRRYSALTRRQHELIVDRQHELMVQSGDSNTGSTSLRRTPTIRIAPGEVSAQPPLRVAKLKYNLSDPDGCDVHALLEPVGYGSLSQPVPKAPQVWSGPAVGR